MRHFSRSLRHVLFGLVGLAVLASFTACEKKKDPAAATASGGAASRRVVMTLKGADH